jgi:hypothetical protein
LPRYNIEILKKISKNDFREREIVVESWKPCVARGVKGVMNLAQCNDNIINIKYSEYIIYGDT